MFRQLAYGFETNLSMRTMRRRLNKLGLWHFIERDNDRWGDYIVSDAARPGVVGLHLVQYNGYCSVNIRYHSAARGAAADCKKMLRELRGVILPAIGARHIHVAEYDERAPPTEYE